MIARLRCYLFGHRPRLIAYEVADVADRPFRRYETWGCERCPWARYLEIAHVGVTGPPPAPAGLFERIGEPLGFYLAVAAILGVLALVAVRHAG